MKLSIIISIFLLFAALALQAQEGAGRTFILAFPDTTTNTFDERFPDERFAHRALIHIYSAVDNRVTIRGNGYSRVESVKGGTSSTIDLLDSNRMAPDPIVTSSNAISRNSFRLDAEHPVIVYCWLLTTSGAEAWTPLPVEVWGNEYFVAARPGEVASNVSTGGPFDYNKRSKMAPAEILVVAAYDGTDVEISSTADLLGAPRTITVRLDAGEIYQVQSLVDTSVFADLQPDIGGSRITATKPVGVIAGNTRSQAYYFQEGLGQNAFRNMLVEWLSPVTMHGNEFVYLPTWDPQRPTGGPGEDLSSKRRGEHVRIYATSAGATHGLSLDNSIGENTFFIAADGRFREDFIGVPEARYYITDQPAQAMMNSTGIPKYIGWTGGGGYQGVEFQAWSPFMVEMVPRHRWSSFSPFYAPVLSDSMWHYIDVVTDSVHRNDVYLENGERFVFDRGTIRESGLVWGTMEVRPGVSHSLQGRNGARFSGHVYGLWRGREGYWPGGARALYWEYPAISYGYPLSSNHRPPPPSDAIRIDTTIGCSATTITITQTAASSMGIDSIWLEWGNNARIVSIQPLLLSGAMTARVVVAPVDAENNASAILMIRDRAGVVTRYRHTYHAEKLRHYVLSQWYGEYIDPTVPGEERSLEIMVRNPLGRSVRVEDLRLEKGDRRYRIDSISLGELPVDIPPDGSMRIMLSVAPDRGHTSFRDTLNVISECLTTRIPLEITTSVPLLGATDIDFGTFVGLGAASSETMTIYNRGDGRLMFGGGPEGEPARWPHPEHFIIAPADLELLGAARLTRWDSLTLTVGFRGVSEGTFVDTVRFFSNDSGRGGQAIWRATVRRVAAAGNSLSAPETGAIVRPNPTAGGATISFRTELPGRATLVITDGAGREVARIVTASLPAGEQRLEWNGSELPAGVYFYRLFTLSSTASGSIVLVR